jgi:hypothetical protein
MNNLIEWRFFAVHYCLLFMVTEYRRQSEVLLQKTQLHISSHRMSHTGKH